MTLNIMNPKQLEKQMKLLETKIQELQTEIDGLEKMRIACQILLGNQVELPTAKEARPVAPEPKPVKEKAPKAPKPSFDISQQITDVLRNRADGMTADEIYDELRGQGIDIPGKSPVQSVYTTLEKHPELFLEADNGQWKPTTAGAAVPTSH